LIKHRDKYAKESDITKKDKSLFQVKRLKQLRNSKNIGVVLPKKKSASKKSRNNGLKKKRSKARVKKLLPKIL
jgi:hypothetical protein